MGKISTSRIPPGQLSPLLPLELLKAEEFQGTESVLSVEEVPPSASPAPFPAPQERGRGRRTGSQVMNAPAGNTTGNVQLKAEPSFEEENPSFCVNLARNHHRKGTRLCLKEEFSGRSGVCASPALPPPCQRLKMSLWGKMGEAASIS